jgi:hypothetical protein
MRLFRVEGFPTAPQGNVTAASHKYVLGGSFQQNATEREKCGEAGRA